MDGTYYAINTSQSLCHHGVKGMRWGHRRYQNEDGSLTPAGREHYAHKIVSNTKVYSKKKMARNIAGIYSAINVASSAKTAVPILAKEFSVMAAAGPAAVATGIGSLAVGSCLGLGINYAMVRLGQRAFMRASRNHAINKMAKDNIKKDPTKNLIDEKERLKDKADLFIRNDKSRTQRPKAVKYLEKHGYQPSDKPGHDKNLEYIKKNNNGQAVGYSYIGGNNPIKKAKHDVRYDRQLARQRKVDTKKLPKDPNPSVPKNQRQYSSSGNKKIEDKLYDHGYRPIEKGSSYFGKYSHTGHGYYVDSTDGDKYVKDYIKSANKTYKDENRWARKNYKK